MISLLSMVVLILVMFIFLIGSYYNLFNLQHYENDTKSVTTLSLLLIIGMAFAFVILVG